MAEVAVHPKTGGHEAHELSFVRKYVFSTDHKIIGIQYMITSMLFLLSGFTMMLLMRWQLAFPGTPIPLVGQWLPETMAPGGIMLPEFYNQLGAMHGTIMVFLGIVPLGVAAFGNFVLPLQIGAKDMAFPFLNMLSYWIFLIGGVLMLSSFAMPGGAAQSGWTSYSPLADLAPPGQTMWLIAMTFIITSSLFGAINFIVTTINLRAKGMTWLRLPFFVWCQFVTAILLVLAFPVLQGGAILQLMDRVAKANFFIPANLIFGGAPVEQPGGGNPLLWQHLFWFLAHPEVYVLLLPEFGIVAEILANGTRKPLFGYKELVISVCAIGVLSFIVWAHHMFLSGMKTGVTKFFTVTTMIISIPSVMVLTCFLLSFRGASIRYNTPMLFAIAFLPLFGIGGLTGLPAPDLSVMADDLADEVADGQDRVQRRHRLLVDHRDVAAADRLHRTLGQLNQVLVPEADGAPDDPPRRVGQEAPQRQRGHRLAASGLADEPEDLTPVEGEADTVDGDDAAGVGLEARAQL